MIVLVETSVGHHAGASLDKCHKISVKTEDFHPDVIVDWGGTSYKVFLNGKRIGTEASSRRVVKKGRSDSISPRLRRSWMPMHFSVRVASCIENVPLHGILDGIYIYI